MSAPERNADVSLPDGLDYLPQFLSSGETSELEKRVAGLEYHQVQMRGQVAKRTTVHFGWTYDYERWRIEPASPIPQFLIPVRARAAEVAGVQNEDFAEVLVSRYPPGAGIGWHRDAPMFGDVVAGISLGSSCTLRFRRKQGDTFARAGIDLEPGSIYLLRGSARWAWQHSIHSTPALRYSVTFRTIKEKRRYS